MIVTGIIIGSNKTIVTLIAFKAYQH